MYVRHGLKIQYQQNESCERTQKLQLLCWYRVRTVPSSVYLYRIDINHYAIFLNIKTSLNVVYWSNFL